MAREFRVTVYGVRKGAAVDPVTGNAEKTFDSLQRGHEWAVSVSKHPGNPVYGVHTWNDAEQSLWAVRIQPDWTWRFVVC